MARIRTIKPAFFTSEDICKVQPLGRLLFQGLWIEADREGYLADSPFQSEVITGEAAFARAFPRQNGYRVFLIRTPPDKEAGIAAALGLGFRANGKDMGERFPTLIVDIPKFIQSRRIRFVPRQHVYPIRNSSQKLIGGKN